MNHKFNLFLAIRSSVVVYGAITIIIACKSQGGEVEMIEKGSKTAQFSKPQDCVGGQPAAGKPAEGDHGHAHSLHNDDDKKKPTPTPTLSVTPTVNPTLLPTGTPAKPIGTPGIPTGVNPVTAAVPAKSECLPSGTANQANGAANPAKPVATHLPGEDHDEHEEGEEHDHPK